MIPHSHAIATQCLLYALCTLSFIAYGQANWKAEAMIAVAYLIMVVILDHYRPRNIHQHHACWLVSLLCIVNSLYAYVHYLTRS